MLYLCMGVWAKEWERWLLKLYRCLDKVMDEVSLNIPVVI